MTGTRSLRHLLVVCAVFTVLAGCASRSNHIMAAQCDSGLNAGYRDIDLAKAQGYAGTEAWARAATLLAAAKVQQQYENFPNCVEAVDSAKRYIRQSRGVRK